MNSIRLSRSRQDAPSLPSSLRRSALNTASMSNDYVLQTLETCEASIPTKPTAARLIGRWPKSLIRGRSGGGAFRFQRGAYRFQRGAFHIHCRLQPGRKTRQFDGDGARTSIVDPADGSPAVREKASTKSNFRPELHFPLASPFVLSQPPFCALLRVPSPGTARAAISIANHHGCIPYPQPQSGPGMRSPSAAQTPWRRPPWGLNAISCA
jgi:hypothetical protein